MKIFILSGIYLIICTYTDIRYKKISTLLSIVIGLSGLFISLCSLWNPDFPGLDIFSLNLEVYAFSEHTSFFTLALSLSLSLFMLIVSILTKGSFGTGDCVMLAVLACFMTPYHLMSVLVFGLFFSGIASLLLITVKKYSRKDTIFFAPFLLTGHICCFLLNTL